MGVSRALQFGLGFGNDEFELAAGLIEVDGGGADVVGFVALADHFEHAAEVIAAVGQREGMGEFKALLHEEGA